MKNMLCIKRQGDLKIQKITGKMPKGLIKTDNKVLLEGEVTGHKHKLIGSVQVYELDNEKYFKVSNKQTAQLVHEEHNTLDLDSGFYKATRQREYSYIENGIRNVLD